MEGNIMLGSFGRCAAFSIAAGLGAVAISASPAVAATNVPGANVFASGSPDQGMLESGGGSKSGFGADWSGLISTWRSSPSATQHWGYTLPAGEGGATYNYQLTGNPLITFTPTSESDALDEFGTVVSNKPGRGAYAIQGKVDQTQDPVADAQDPPVLDGFVANEGPTEDQMQAARSAAPAHEINVPVAQTPVMLLFSLPSGVTLASGAKLPLINNAAGDRFSTVQAIFDGRVGPSHQYPANTWGALLMRAGFTPVRSGTPTPLEFLESGSARTHTGGYQRLQLEVRNDSAPETQAIQTFLNFSGDPSFRTTHQGGNSTPARSEVHWPADANDGAGSNRYPSGPLGTNSDGATLVKNTLATPGTIGYATMPDAVYTVAGEPFEGAPQSTTYQGSAAHQYLFAELQSNEEHSRTRHYAEPGQVVTNSSGSLEAVPNLYTGSEMSTECGYPSHHAYVGEWCEHQSRYGDWFAGSLSDPDVYGHSDAGGSGAPVNAYPISEVTWLTAWNRYDSSLSGSSFYGSTANATDTGNTVAAYLNWVTKPTGGQSAIQSSKVGFAELPSGFVQSEAQLYASEIATTDVAGYSSRCGAGC
jgi:hypothetical protein